MIKFENVTKTYKGGNAVLDNLTFEIADGEVVVLIGPSGCGKTTTLKMINKLIAPTKGHIFIDAQDISTMDSTALRRKQGYVVQSIGLFPHLTIKENIELIPTLAKTDPDVVAERTGKLMEMVGLSPEDYFHRYPNQLSGGQQQRIGVARAFAMNPEMILMDEPFSALDPITRTSLQDELVRIQHKQHKTIVFVTHDMDEAIRIADKICIMNEGKILQYDSPEQILKNPADDFVRNFVGKRRIWTQPEFIRAEDIAIMDPITAHGDITLLRAAEIMQSFRVDSLLVVDEYQHLLGVMSISSLRKGFKRDTPIGQIMKTDLSIAKPSDNILTILERFTDGISTMPVVGDDGCLFGLITRSCLVNALSQQYIQEEG